MLVAALGIPYGARRFALKIAAYTREQFSYQIKN